MCMIFSRLLMLWLISRGNVLKIARIHKEDRGTYYCVAENGVGKGARRNIAVEVEFAPVITAPRPRLGQALQYDMDLECHVEAYPPPAIVWIKDDVQLSNNQHYRFVCCTHSRSESRIINLPEVGRFTVVIYIILTTPKTEKVSRGDSVAVRVHHDRCHIYSSLNMSLIAL